METEQVVLPPKCQELRAKDALAEWVLTLPHEKRAMVLNKVQAFLEGAREGVFILRNGIIEIRVDEPTTLYAYLFFDTLRGKFDFMRGMTVDE